MPHLRPSRNRPKPWLLNTVAAILKPFDNDWSVRFLEEQLPIMTDLVRNWDFKGVFLFQQKQQPFLNI